METFHVDLADEWVLVVDGSTYSEFGVQLGNQNPVALAFAASAPAADTFDRIQMSFDRMSDFGKATNGANVYARALHAGQTSRLFGYKITAA